MSETLRDKVVNTFRDNGGTWKLSAMAKILNENEDAIKEVWDGLEEQGLLKRERTARLIEENSK